MTSRPQGRTQWQTRNARWGGASSPSAKNQHHPSALPTRSTPAWLRFRHKKRRPGENRTTSPLGLHRFEVCARHQTGSGRHRDCSRTRHCPSPTFTAESLGQPSASGQPRETACKRAVAALMSRQEASDTHAAPRGIPAPPSLHRVGLASCRAHPVVARQAVDAGFHKNEAELAIAVLAIELQMFAHGHRLLD